MINFTLLHISLEQYWYAQLYSLLINPFSLIDILPLICSLSRKVRKNFKIGTVEPQTSSSHSFIFFLYFPSMLFLPSSYSILLLKAKCACRCNFQMCELYLIFSLFFIRLEPYHHSKIMKSWNLKLVCSIDFPVENYNFLSFRNLQKQ